MLTTLCLILFWPVNQTEQLKKQCLEELQTSLELGDFGWFQLEFALGENSMIFKNQSLSEIT